MNLLTSFYFPNNENRKVELIDTLKKNLSKVFIEKIHLYITENDYKTFHESSLKNIKNYDKIDFIIKNYQPKYKELFEVASEYNDKIIAICNSDIEFSISNLDILNKLDENTCFFLTRHEYDMTHPLITNFGGSHDAFIFKSNILKDKIKNKDLSYIKYIQNTPGIESLLTIFCIETLNYKIHNPCIEIKLIHHHKSCYRTYNSAKPIGHTYPIRLGGIYENTVWCKYIINPCKLLD
tara:strand:- start:6355 stop:7065 length:711 start_codon:yes stop_codon:yes gene_type:complete